MSLRAFTVLLVLATASTISSVVSSTRPTAAVAGHDVTDGADVPVRRFVGDERFGRAVLKAADPFLVFDFYNNTVSSSSGGSTSFKFPAHPHAGFVEIRYILNGSIEHLDSCGVHGRVEQGGFHILRTMRGIAHEETIHVDKDSGLFRGFQLWLDVPSELKRTGLPSYRSVSSNKADADATAGAASLTTRNAAFGWTVTERRLSQVIDPVHDMSLEHLLLVDVSGNKVKQQRNQDSADELVSLFEHTVVHDRRRASCTAEETDSCAQDTTSNDVVSTCIVFATEGGPISVGVVGEPENERTISAIVGAAIDATARLFVSVLTSGETLRVRTPATTSSQSLRFLVACAPPLRQPIFKWQGLVFSDRASLDEAVASLKAGNFSGSCE